MIVDADTPQRIDAARRLMVAYAEALDFDLWFQDFDKELASLPGAYAPPGGALLLAEEEGAAIGCVALRRLDEGVCEMKRLYVAPAGRGKGVGLRLAQAVIERGRQLGYRAMRLDTVSTMTAARRIYLALGFRPIGPYCHNPLPGAEFYELAL